MTYTPEMKLAFEQVGRFLHHFSLMEEALNGCIGQVLSLQGEQIVALGSVVPLWKKVDLFRDTIISQQKKDKSWRDAASTRFSSLSQIVSDRNIVAHHSFSGTNGGDLTFKTYKLKTKEIGVNNNATIWSSQKIDQKCNELGSATEDLKRIRSELHPVFTLESGLFATSGSEATMTKVPGAGTAPIAVKGDSADPSG